MLEYITAKTKNALKFGLNESILLNHFVYWLKNNKAEGVHIHQHRPWTFNTIKGLAILHPYWSEAQVRRIVESLIQQGVLITGNFNKSKYNRTRWFSLADKHLGMIDKTKHPHLSKLANRKVKNDRSMNSRNIISSPTVISPKGERPEYLDKYERRQKEMQKRKTDKYARRKFRFQKDIGQ